MLLLSVQAARLVWLFATPIGPLGALPPGQETASGKADLAALTRLNPFLPKVATASDDDSGPQDLAFSLFGVRADGRGGGAAIIASHGGPQMVYAVGDALADGVLLTSVGPDHVVLAQGRHSTKLPLLASSGARSTTPAALPAYLARPRTVAAPDRKVLPVAIDPKKFIDEVGLMPRTADGRVTGYTLLPRGGGETLRLAGLAAGDVIVALNGNRMTPERYSELAQELTGASEVQLTVERGSETKTITLQTGR